jgi:hypothetical protein
MTVRAAELAVLPSLGFVAFLVPAAGLVPVMLLSADGGRGELAGGLLTAPTDRVSTRTEDHRAGRWDGRRSGLDR